jgi:hypothetical protein
MSFEAQFKAAIEDSQDLMEAFDIGDYDNLDGFADDLEDAGALPGDHQQEHKEPDDVSFDENDFNIDELNLDEFIDDSKNQSSILKEWQNEKNNRNQKIGGHRQEGLEQEDADDHSAILKEEESFNFARD